MAYNYFSKALFERLVFGGAYIWWEICVTTKLIGLASIWKGNKKKLCCCSNFCFVLFCIGGQCPSISFGGLILEG